jgi:hypothetical protein
MHRAATVVRPLTEDNITPRREGAKNVQYPPASAARRVASDDFFLILFQIPANLARGYA